MRPKLHILMVEDSALDAEIVLRELHRGGFEPVCKRVDTAPAFTAALAAGGWDAVIADYNLPEYSAIEALVQMQRSGQDLPFIIVSGAIGEEVAVAAMKCGAHDYILKNSLARLVPAVERELRDARVRRERRESQEAVLRLGAIVESSGDAIVGEGLDGKVTSWNCGAIRLFGYSAEEMIGRPVLKLVPPDREEEETRILERLRRGGIADHFETVRVRKDGRRVEVSVTISPIRDRSGKVIGASGISRDITERRRAETAVAALSKLGQSLASASTPYDAARVIGNIADELFTLDAFSLDLYSTEEDRIETVLNVDTVDGEKREMPPTHGDGTPSPLARKIMLHGAELILRERDKSLPAAAIAFGDISRTSASLMYVPIRNQARVIGLLSVQSYTAKLYDHRSLRTLQTLAEYCGGALERIRARNELRLSEERYKQLAESAPAGIFECDGSGRCTYVNARWSEISGLGLEASHRLGWLAAIHPEERADAQENWRRAVAEGRGWDGQHRVLTPDGVVRWVRALAAAVSSSDGEPGYVGTVEDITAIKQSEDGLRSSREQLRALAAHLQSVREEERKHITREIHDELGQALTGFKMDLAWIRNRIQAEEWPESQPILDKIKSMGALVDSTATLVRRLCTELRPGVLDDLGLVAAIEWQAREYQSRTGIGCAVNMALDDLTVDPERSTALFRIFQEILTNVARHAKATQVDAVFKVMGGQIWLEARDNGRGIKPDEIAGAKSLGLLGMRERALVLGGEVEVQGTAGKGTVVTVKMPLPGFKPEAAKTAKAGEGNSHAPDNLKTKRKAIH